MLLSIRGADGCWGADAVRRTDRAVLVKLATGREVWLPLSQCRVDARGKNVRVEAWLIKAKSDAGELTAEDVKCFG